MKSRIALLALFSVICASWHFAAAQPATAPAEVDPKDAALSKELAAMRFRFPLRVVGTVTDAETNEPIEKFIVLPETRRRGLPGEGDYAAARQFASGTYEFINTDPEPEFTLRIEAEGYAPVTSPRLSEHIVATFNAKLKRAANVTGQVVTADGEPVLGADVLLVTSQTAVQVEQPDNPGYQPYARVKTNEHGYFTHRPVEGKYLLIALHDGGLARVRGADHDPANPLRLEPWARIEGALRVGRAPAAGQSIYVRHDQRRLHDEPWANYSMQAMVDEAGTFRFRRVPAGKGAIVVMVPLRGPQGSTMSGMGMSKRFDVKPGERLTVELGGRGRPVVGHVPPLPDLPEGAFANGNLTPTDAAPGADALTPRSFAIEADGRFRIDDVEAGSYRLDVQFQAIDAKSHRWQPLGGATKTFTIDPIPGGQSDEPLDLGTLEAQTPER
jgi:hypothetical protein